MTDVDMKDAAPLEPAAASTQLKFRNYFPRDENLRKHRLAPLPDYAKEINERFDYLSNSVDDESLLEMAPKKPNWDLKRDVEPRYEVLQRQTQRAILDLIRALPLPPTVHISTAQF